MEIPCSTLLGRFRLESFFVIKGGDYANTPYHILINDLEMGVLDHTDLLNEITIEELFYSGRDIKVIYLGDIYFLKLEDGNTVYMRWK